MLQRRGCIHFPLTAEFKFRRWPVLQDLADPKNAENQKPVISLGEKKRSLGGGLMGVHYNTGNICCLVLAGPH